MIRHIIYLSDEQVRLFEWQNNQLVIQLQFELNECGLDNFKNVVKNLSNHPVQILIDLQEEDYQRETIPYAGKKEQAFMSNRLLKKYYRDIPYQYFEIQGREEKGRKDSRVLLASVSIDNDLKQFIDTFTELGFTIAGIWSTPLFGHQLVAHTKPDSDNFILVSKENGFYRESIFINKEMIVSRKNNIASNLNKVQEATLISSSIDHLHKFSTNKRYIGFQDKMEVICLIEEPVFKVLEETRNNPQIQYRLSPIDKLFGKIELPNDQNMDMDVVYSHLCSKADIINPHYKSSDVKDNLIKRKANNRFFYTLSMSSFVFIFVAAVLSLKNHSTEKISDKTRIQADAFDTNYNNEFSSIQPMLENIDTINTFFSGLALQVKESESSPTGLFPDLGAILSKPDYQLITLGKIRWKRYKGVESDTLRSSFNIATDENNNSEAPTDIDQIDTQVYAHISGSFDHEKLEYADAVNTMVNFNNALKAMKDVNDVHMLTAPVDIRLHKQFFDFRGSFLSPGNNKSNRFEFILSIKPKQVNGQ